MENEQDSRSEQDSVINPINPEVTESNVKLLTGESVVSTEIFDIQTPPEHPSAIKALKLLTDAERMEDIGERGPSIASRATETNKEIPELRLFEALFGRDSLRVASDLMDRFPALARSTILELASQQGTKEDIASEEQPGRIIHESRDPNDPIAQKITAEKGWGWPYYGSIDSTPMFVRTVVDYCQQEGNELLHEKIIDKDGQEKFIAESLHSAILWLVDRVNDNPNGLLEFKRLNPRGIENQAWKDSWDSYSHSDGTIANHESGIASVEVQGLAYDALLGTAELYDELSNTSPENQESSYSDWAELLRERAEVLRQEVFGSFIVEDERGMYFAMGTDRDSQDNLRPLKVRASNMGHLLDSRLLEGNDPQTNQYKEAIIRAIFSPDMLNASGVRSLSNGEKRFRPGAYHNGNVWLWDTHLISLGLEKQGYHGLAWELRERIWSVVNKYNKFPEFARGDDSAGPLLSDRKVVIYDEVNQRNNTVEQPPQEIQAWTVAAIVASKYKRGDQALRRQGALPLTASGPQANFENEILASLGNE